jgi:hypothetical protein
MSATELNVTLVIPGLFPFSHEEMAKLSHTLPHLGDLSRLLTRAKVLQAPEARFETRVGRLFGWDEEPPIAPLQYWGEKGTGPEDYVLRADPVYLHPDRDHLVLLAAENLSLREEEARAILESIQKTYADLPWSLEMGAPNRWYLRLAQTPHIATHPLAEVFGKAIDHYLPRGEGAKQWQTIMNELQMLLHGHPVNQQRQRRGELPVNSLWFWGGGKLPQHAPSETPRWEGIWSNDPLTIGLARWCGRRCAPLPPSAGDWLAQNPQGEQLIVLDDVRLLARADFSAWGAALQVLNQKWFGPLMAMSRKRTIRHLLIEVLNGKRYQVTAMGLRAWWKKDRAWWDRR